MPGHETLQRPKTTCLNTLYTILVLVLIPNVVISALTPSIPNSQEYWPVNI